MYNIRWYGTPGNIYKDNRILKFNYNHGLKKILKAVSFPPVMQYSTKEIKCKTGARLELDSLRLLACLLTN